MKPPGDLMAAAAMILTTAMPATLPPRAAATAANWPLFRGDALLSGRSGAALPESPAAIWTQRAAAGFESSAVIADGVVYAGSMDGTLHALSAADGKTLFTYTAGAGIKSSPSVFAGTVYFGDESGVLHAVDATTGKGLWRYTTGAAIASSAVRVEDRIIFGSNDNDLYGLDLSGRKVWSVETSGYVYATVASVVWDGTKAVVSTGCDGFLRIIRAKDGEILKKIELGAYVGASPALDGERAFVGTFENQILGVDLRAGKILWSYENPEKKFPFLASAALDGRTAFVGGRDKTVVALDVRTGKVRWTYAARSRVDASALLAGDRLVTATTGGEILSLDRETGKLVWQFETGSSIVGSPALGAGRLVIGTTDGTLYAFGAS